MKKLFALALLFAFVGSPLVTRAEGEEMGTFRACLIMAENDVSINETNQTAILPVEETIRFRLSIGNELGTETLRKYTANAYSMFNADLISSPQEGVKESLCSNVTQIPYGKYTYDEVEFYFSNIATQERVTYKYYEQINAAQEPTGNRLRPYGEPQADPHPLADGLISIDDAAPVQTLFILAEFEEVQLEA